MNKKPTFKAIQNFETLIEENELFTQFSNSSLPDRYDSNYVSLHFSPTVEEFEILENIQKEYITYENPAQNHLKFVYPEDTGIRMDLFDYLNEQQYEIGKLELMCAQPYSIEINYTNPSISCEIITSDKLNDFLVLNYNDNKRISNEFADFSGRVYRYQFDQPHSQFLLARLDNKPVASLILHISDDFIEIDGVLTDINYRKRGVASHMIDYVMNHINQNEKPLILVADAEDTPKKLYQKLGFECISTQISMEKVFSNKDFFL